MLRRRSIRILALLTPVGVALGCVNMQLKLDDNDQFTPSGRISYEFYPGNAQRRSGSALDLVTGSGGTAAPVQSFGVQPTIAIEGAIAAVDGHDHEQVPAGEQVELDEVIPGPARLTLDSENLRGHLAGRAGVRFFDVLSLESIIGLGVDSTELRVRGGGVEATDEDVRPGFLFGGRASVRPMALFDIYTQYLANLVGDWDIIEDTEVGLELNLQRNVALFAGYRWWSYSDTLNNESNREIDIRGPTAGASLRF